jgi:hypothetical protein
MADETEIDHSFYGRATRRCGEHRTVGPHRAWCLDCAEWCSPAISCGGCSKEVLIYDELDKYLPEYVPEPGQILMCVAPKSEYEISLQMVSEND